jgi:TRAP-type C4-dicarboxylate transport system permease small subunit
VTAARAWHLLTAVVALAALGLQLVLVINGDAILVDHDPPNLVERILRYFAYFTIESNILVLATTARLARDAAYDAPRWRVVRIAAVSGITVTGLVHWFLLRPLLHLDGADLVADKVLHLVVPILAVLGWLAFGPRPRIDWPACLRAALWPLAWLVVMLASGAVTGWYPYPFLDHREHGWDHVAVVCVGILVLFFAIFAGMREYDRRVRPTPRVPTPEYLSTDRLDS